MINRAEGWGWFALTFTFLLLGCPAPAPLQAQRLGDSGTPDPLDTGRIRWDAGSKRDSGHSIDSGPLVSARDTGPLHFDSGISVTDAAGMEGMDASIGETGATGSADGGMPDTMPQEAPDAGAMWACAPLPMSCPEVQTQRHRMISTSGCRFALEPPDWQSGNENVERLVRRVGNRRSMGQLLADLNREGRGLGGWYLGRSIVGAEGFRWNTGDDNVRYWMPQGVSGSSDAWDHGRVNGRRIVVVAWYDNDEGPGSNRGVRVSFADHTDPEDVRYRHALLVEPLPTAIPNFRGIDSHAGGIVWYGNYLYVAQTRTGFRVFDLTNIMQVETDEDEMGYVDGQYYARRYKYIIPQIGLYRLHEDSCRVKFSFVALDRSTSPHRFLSGEYHSDDDSGRLVHWRLTPNTHRLELREGLARGEDAAVSGETKMQGAVTYEGRWYISSSTQFLRYGKLYTTAPGEGASSERPWPYGPEDLYVERDRDRLWTATEFRGYRKVMNLRRRP